MINKKFIDDWSGKYDENVAERDKDLEEKIRKVIMHLFPKGKVEYVTRDILYDIVDWKAPRRRKNVLKNREEFVREVTKHCFLSSDEQFKIEGLTILKGVKYRVASAVLHFCFPSEYTIMDWRAWESLQEEKELPKDYKIKDDFEHWQKYLNVCREISHRCSLDDLRKLDKALWQYSKRKSEIKPSVLPILILIIILSLFTLGHSSWTEYKNVREKTFVESKIGDKTDIDKITDIISEAEIKDRKADLEKWIDPKRIKELSEITLTDEYIKNLYNDFKKTVVTPPKPGAYTEYSIPNAEESLVKVEQLGREMHNLFFAISDQGFTKHGKLIGIMRDVLYIDRKHIPYAIRHNNGRDIYWYKLHTEGIKEAEKEYQRLFKRK